MKRSKIKPLIVISDNEWRKNLSGTNVFRYVGYANVMRCARFLLVLFASVATFAPVAFALWTWFPDVMGRTRAIASLLFLAFLGFWYVMIDVDLDAHTPSRGDKL